MEATSLTIIDNTVPNAPIWSHKPKPSIFRTTLEKQKYWEKQKTLWVEGSGEVPGTLIFKTQECWIKNRVTGEVLRPQARFPDLMIHQFIDKQRKNKRASANIIKPRGIGLSADFGCLANYFVRVHAGTSTLMTSKDQTSIGRLFGETVMQTFDRMDEDIKPTILLKNETLQKCFLKVAVPVKGNTAYAESRIFCRETSELPRSPNNFSGEGGIVGLYDELPLHPRRSALMRSSKECFRDPQTGEQIGLMIGGGTVEHELSGEQFKQFATFINDLDEEDLLFIPYWWGKFLDANGYPDKEKAEEWRYRNLEELAKKTDQDELIAFKKNHPSCMEDIFQMASNSYFENDVDLSLRNHRESIILNPPKHYRGALYELSGQVLFDTQISGGTFHKDEKKNPPITIVEEPKPMVDYYLVADGTATGKKYGGDTGSWFAGIIMKGYDPQGNSWSPVCCYYERPETVESGYRHLLFMGRYFDKYKNFKGMMAEANASTSDHFSSFLAHSGFAHWIIKRKDLSGKGYSQTNKSFQFVNDVVRDFQIRCANAFLRKYVHHICLIPLLNSLVLPAEENADLRDAWLMFFVLFPDVDSDKRKTTEPKKYRVREYYRDNEGRLLTRWVDNQAHILGRG